MAFTLDGITKGYAADLMSRELTLAGRPDHLVNAGGDIVAGGRKGPNRPWRAAVENPFGRTGYPQIVPLAAGQALATSGEYEARKNGRNHLCNPRIGLRIPSSPACASAIAPDGLTADALATASFVMPPHAAIALADSLPGCACCLLQKDGSLRVSAR